ncbi:MAG: hypothetical protein GF416_02405 [Candidatus Altiarchaeales archaeon]|nr:hypothetical protein [Candidatus Altiarchaeales archaeon]MBD3415971.1 hypothetical protein [Candidatus Altiarchaeales archaeon]
MKKTTTLFVLALLATTAWAANDLAASTGRPAFASAKAVAEPDIALYRPYDQVKVKIDPSRKYVKNGETAVYYITLADNHPRPICALEEEYDVSCPVPLHTYKIYVNGLPFEIEYPEEVEVPAGDAREFKLVVDTGAPVVEAEIALESVEAHVADDGETVSGSVGASNPTQKILVGKPYYFRVSAKSDDAYGAGKAVLYVGRNIIPPTPGDEVDVKLYKGWNIVSLPGIGKVVKAPTPEPYVDGSVPESYEYDYSDAEVSVEDVESLPERHPRMYFFIYLKDENRYATFAEAVRLMGRLEFRRYLQHNAFWVYTPSDEVLSFRVSRFTSYNGMPVGEGWNFIPVTRDMNGVSLDDVSGTCDFQRLYMWDKQDQQWYKIDGSHVFSSRELYTGIVASAEEDCKLGKKYAEPDIEPPSLPD